MAQTTGPILAMGAVTLTNAVIVHGRPMDWRIPIATGFTAGLFALLEKGAPGFAKGLAWLAFAAVLMVRVQPDVPTPAETIVAYWESGGTRTK